MFFFIKIDLEYDDFDVFFIIFTDYIEFYA